MAHVDLAAAGLTFWALEAYLAQRWGVAAVWFSFAVLAKETAVLAPLALLMWELVSRLPFQPLQGLFLASKAASLKRSPDTNFDADMASFAVWHRRYRVAYLSLLAPAAVLAVWYAYHYARTGYVFGNPEFFRYNVQATMSGVRIVLAFLMRMWQSLGYMHLWVLALLVFWAMTRAPLQDGDTVRHRIDIPVQLSFAAIIFIYVVAMAVVGGAVLARYMLTVVPLVILVGVSTLWRRTRKWLWLTGVVWLAFVMALFFNPPYGFSPEDNLAYRDYVLMHEDAAAFLQQRYPNARVLTAWPASDEISRTYLGYVNRPLQVVRIEDFSLDEVAGASQERSRFDAALVFSTKYEPAHPFFERWRAWERVKTRFFGFHRDVPPAVAAQMLGGRIVFTEKSTGQWVAVIEIERTFEAMSTGPR